MILGKGHQHFADNDVEELTKLIIWPDCPLIGDKELTVGFIERNGEAELCG